MQNYQDIKVSVIVPVYNVADYITECLDSLINQSLKEIEIILINDCSTDNSLAICEEYALKDNRIVIINNETNIRQGLSRNKGIEIANGEYIGFVDPDDWVDKNYYEKLYKAAINENTNIAKAEVIKVYDDGSLLTQAGLNNCIRKGIQKGIPLCLLFDYEHCSGIYKKDLIIANDVKYADIRNAEDNIFLLQACFFLQSITIVYNTNYYYRQHNKSTEAKREKVYYESILQCFKLHQVFINNQSLQKELYDKIFYKGFEFAKSRFSEIKINPSLKSYEAEYIDQIFEILLMYKFDTGYLLSAYYNGLSISTTLDNIKKSKSYRIAKILTWLPKSLIDFLSKKDNHSFYSRIRKIA